MTAQDLVRDRFDRIRAAAGAIDLDVLILGRSDDVRYVSGASQLWTAGTRPFGAVATLLVGRGELYVLSTWEEGMSKLVPFEHLHGVTWNPATIAGRLAALDDLAGARRIGVDGLSPGFARLLAKIAPQAEIVPADHCLQAARRVKLPAEIDAIRAATAVAVGALDHATASLGSDSIELDVAARAVSEASREGRVQPAGVPTVRATATGHYDQPVGARPLAVDAGALVRVDRSFLVEGYEGGIGRTVAVDLAGPTISALHTELDEAQHRLVSACRAGAAGKDLDRDAGDHWQVRGVGMGFEPPIIDRRTGHAAMLETGMVLSVESAVFLESFGTLSRRDVVVVDDGAPEVLTDR